MYNIALSVTISMSPPKKFHVVTRSVNAPNLEGDINPEGDIIGILNNAQIFLSDDDKQIFKQLVGMMVYVSSETEDRVVMNNLIKSKWNTASVEVKAALMQVSVLL